MNSHSAWMSPTPGTAWVRDVASVQRVQDWIAAFRVAHDDAPLVLFDVPLLYETGAAEWFDAVAVVSAPPEVQAARVLSRPGMTPERFHLLLSRQMPDAEKRARADYVIATDSPDSARRGVDAIIAAIGAKAQKTR